MRRGSLPAASPRRRLQLFAGETVVHRAAVAEFQLEHAALAAKLVFPDGIEPEFQFDAVFVDSLRVKLAVLQVNLVDDEIVVFGMLVLAAEALPFGLVGIWERNFLDGLNRFWLPVRGNRPQAFHAPIPAL